MLSGSTVVAEMTWLDADRKIIDIRGRQVALPLRREGVGWVADLSGLAQGAWFVRMPGRTERIFLMR